jgi:7-carboxy-7-deazaguanine synthase
LKLVEVFHSIQGEGLNIGKPAIFIRLAGCNLRCSWCDSKYASQPTQTFEVDSDAILNLLLQYPSCKHVVWTGGEPLLQAKEIQKTSTELKKRGYYQEMETNGTISPFPLNNLMDQWNVSPKLAGQGQIPSERMNFVSLLTWATLMQKVWWKFVIDTPEDISEMLMVIDKLQIERDRVIVMPQMTTVNMHTFERMTHLVDLAKKHGFRFSPRLHILLYGNKRGV